MTPPGASSARARSSQLPAKGPGAIRGAEAQRHPSVAPAGALRVVGPEELKARTRLRRARATLAAALLLVVIACFVAVISHAVLGSRQLELDNMKASAASEAALSRNLAARVGQLATPARLVQGAGRLGMVAPRSVTYIGSANPSSSRPKAVLAPTGSARAHRKPARSSFSKPTKTGSSSAGH